MSSIHEKGPCPECGREDRFYYFEQPLHSLGLMVKAARCRNCGLRSVRGRRIYDPDDYELRRVPLVEWCRNVHKQFGKEIDNIAAREEARR